MSNQKEGDKMSITKEQLERHIKTHTERSNDDRNAVKMLGAYLRSDGKIFDKFEFGDKWPNVDGTFEIVPEPRFSRNPTQNFIVQIKGTSVSTETDDGCIKYQLKSLAFPAYIANEVTLDPGILFLVINPNKRNQERVFWKYMSAQFLSSIDFDKDSCTINFTADDEIKDTDESIDSFVNKLNSIAETHSYIKQLDSKEYTRSDIEKVIITRCTNISDAIKSGNILNYTRDKISQKIFTELEDLCKATLLLNALLYYPSTNLRLAWEVALLNIGTKFLSTFLQGLKYIGLRIPEDGQFERLMLKYYNFLWRIREYLWKNFNIAVLANLEYFPRPKNDEDDEYNSLIASAVDNIAGVKNSLRPNRYYIKRKNVFYVGSERYFEITLQLADKFATKYNRLTVYTKIDISSNYSIRVAFAESEISLWNKKSKVKVITDWKVSIEPSSLNKLSKMLKCKTKLSTNYNEYDSLMNFLTATGINLLDIIDLNDKRFQEIMNIIYEKPNTHYFRDILEILHEKFHQKSRLLGRYTIRYVLIHLQEELLESVLPFNDSLTSDDVYLDKACYPFECHPIFYNIPGRKTNGNTISQDVLRALGGKNIDKYLPYIRIKHLINGTGELYHSKKDIEDCDKNQTVVEYNNILNAYDKKQGRELLEQDGYIYLKEYVDNTVSILNKLLSYANTGNDGQKQLNNAFIRELDESTIDNTKVFALKNVFVDSKVLIIYGAAGTGKTTLMNHISTLMEGRSKLFLTKTHTALENLKRRIKAPGTESNFMGIDSFIKTQTLSNYDVVFVDECSTIDNRTMMLLLEKIDSGSLLVLAGDTYQIESIDFGNWFFYAKSIMPTKATIELTSTWRTEKAELKTFWEGVRFLQPIITEMLVIDGPFSENISEKLFEKLDDDEVVLCLNYDGKFGLNSINNYFQDANPNIEEHTWYDWKYKKGDPILFNENVRFPILYNNLKGRIIDIVNETDSITFTIDVFTRLTSMDVRNYDLEWISSDEDYTRVRFTVYAKDDTKTDEDYEESRMKSIVPFQLAYAVSIHKAQGLEYNSIKVVIPNSNSEKITHGIFYTAITRAKKNLKIFWSADTMEKVISGFNNKKSNQVSLEIVKKELCKSDEIQL